VKPRWYHRYSVVAILKLPNGQDKFFEYQPRYFVLRSNAVLFQAMLYSDFGPEQVRVRLEKLRGRHYMTEMG